MAGGVGVDFVQDAGCFSLARRFAEQAENAGGMNGGELVFEDQIDDVVGKFGQTVIVVENDDGQGAAFGGAENLAAEQRQGFAVGDEAAGSGAVHEHQLFVELFAVALIGIALGNVEIAGARHPLAVFPVVAVRLLDGGNAPDCFADSLAAGEDDSLSHPFHVENIVDGDSHNLLLSAAGPPAGATAQRRCS